MGFHFQKKEKISLFPTASRPVLGSTWLAVGKIKEAKISGLKTRQ
jgi:hypothetical protein